MPSGVCGHHSALAQLRRVRLVSRLVGFVAVPPFANTACSKCSRLGWSSTASQDIATLVTLSILCCWPQGGLQIIRSRKGRPQLVHNGYLFGVRKYYGDRVYWRCMERVSCTARVNTRGNEVTVMCGAHSHGPHIKEILQLGGVVPYEQFHPH
ncbi:hypothetical protein PR048_022858 [Dryococelus australis]|uniref:FLYWCH-type domain-containing protein n=1 Tax=Dryococelus australis TaxID=614101 RepID=A0ABQ9GSI3_9NEOP|nr:hypothetical protein PR048_022858 [Dryococelus australis]